MLRIATPLRGFMCSSVHRTFRPLACSKILTSTVSSSAGRRTLSTNSNGVPPTLSSLEGPPVSKLVPPGQCQFGEDFVSATLVDRVSVSPTSSVLRFALPDATKPLQLSTCACLLAKAVIHQEEVIRPYTPISTNALTGYMDLLVKNYPENGTMSKYLHEEIEIDIDIVGDSANAKIQFKHVPFNVKIQAPFSQSRIVMLAGGTGITPMIQALHAILGTTATDNNHNSKKPKVTLLYGSQHYGDILGSPLLDAWARDYPDQLEVVHALSDEPEGSSWLGKRGVMDRELLENHLLQDGTDANDDTLILVCGPPPMYHALCGSRDEQDTVSGILGEMGYTSEQVYKF
jgi:cytochrome-b5 reductase